MLSKMMPSADYDVPLVSLGTWDEESAVSLVEAEIGHGAVGEQVWILKVRLVLGWIAKPGKQKEVRKLEDGT